MRFAALCAVLAAGAARGSDVVSFERGFNLVTLKLTDGRAEFEWVSDATLRAALHWGTGWSTTRSTRPRVEFAASDLGATLQFRGKWLNVEIEKRGFRVRIRNAAGKVLLEDAAGPQRSEDEVTLERRIAADERFYGLGARVDPTTDARGQSILSSRPLLVSSLGYGLYYPGGRRVLFDVGKTAPDRLRIVSPGPHLEYYFYYGPGTKEVFEQHLQTERVVREFRPSDFEVLERADLPEYAATLPRPRAGSAWTTLAQTVQTLVHSSLSGIPAPAFDLAAYRTGDALAYRRAAQLGSVFPLLYESKPGGDPAVRRAAGRMRGWLHHYLVAYLQEVRDRGIPVVRALALQSTNDLEAARQSDAFMLGDEILVAPILGPSGRRKLYLPMGLWTDLRTNQVHRGRQTIEVEAPPDALPLFVKNGSIVPFIPDDNADLVEAHYFPKLGGEFFLFETGESEWTQLHASPAGTEYRLETETKRTRVYEWVVRHVDRPAEVREPDRPYTEAKRREDLKAGRWYYDTALGAVRVRLEAVAGSDRVINIRY